MCWLHISLTGICISHPALYLHSMYRHVHQYIPGANKSFWWHSTCLVLHAKVDNLVNTINTPSLMIFSYLFILINAVIMLDNPASSLWYVLCSSLTVGISPTPTTLYPCSILNFFIQQSVPNYILKEPTLTTSVVPSLIMYIISCIECVVIIVQTEQLFSASL